MNTRLFHIKCTTTGTNRFPESKYSTAHDIPSTYKGKNTSFLAWCAANIIPDNGVASAIGKIELSQG